MPWKHQGRVIKPGKAWTDNGGTQHPGNWMLWSADEKAAKSVVWEDDPAPFDGRFYWGPNNPKNIADVNEVDSDGNAILDSDGNQVVTKGLKSVWKAIIKEQAAGLLADTDWYIVREAETNTDAPQSVLTYRSNVRSKSGTIETAIDNAADHAAFMALFDVPVDSDGNPTGKAPIADWPDEL
ncbi:hypothetical protein FAMCQIZV_CDS0060 [Phage C72C1]|nr:hypothetical protein FAMCQIZV_CDS0060 [Phage C72C1]